ncbi:MAG TPA: transcriptional repressor LexA [Nitrospiraceae bacterium]|nr:transcriptional repressor LexA [Nitrospiraceae bacterium]
MEPRDLKRARQALGLTQEELAQKLRTTRMTITRYEGGTRRIPGIVDVLIKQLATTQQLPMLGLVAAGTPIETVPQSELVEVPASMIRRGETFVLRVKGQSMQEDGILSGDLVVVQKQSTARNGQTVVALVNREATIKKYYRKETRIELHPANAAMQPIFVEPEDEFTIEGLVIGVIRHCQ